MKPDKSTIESWYIIAETVGGEKTEIDLSHSMQACVCEDIDNYISARFDGNVTWEIDKENED